MSLRYIFKRHRNSVTELRRDAATEVVRLQEKVTKLTLQLELEKSMRCDAVAYADSVKEVRRSSSSVASLDFDYDGAAAASEGQLPPTEYEVEVSDNAPNVPTGEELRREEWRKKLGKSRRAAHFVEDAHGTEETAEELERLITEKYDNEERLKREGKVKDDTIRKLREIVEGQKVKLAELGVDLEEAQRRTDDARSVVAAAVPVSCRRSSHDSPMIQTSS